MPANGELNLENQIIQENHLSNVTTASVQNESRGVSPSSIINSSSASSSSDEEFLTNISKNNNINFLNNKFNKKIQLTTHSSDEDEKENDDDDDEHEHDNKDEGNKKLNKIDYYNNRNFYNSKNLLTKLQKMDLNGISPGDKFLLNNNNNNKNLEKLPRWTSHSVREQHGDFIKHSIEEIVNNAIFKSTERNSKLLNWHDPEELQTIFDMSLKSDSDNDEKLYEIINNIINYSVKTGHPYFINQLYSTVDPYAFIGQLLTDALNPSVYTYEVSPVFILMEEMVLSEMRKIVGFPNNGYGDGIFCPGGSMSNGYGISCARYKFMPEIKMKGLSALPRLVIFTSEDSHYSVQKLASFMGIGIDNVYKIKTDARGKMKIDHLESEIQRAKSEGAMPFLVFATGGTTVLGAFDPIDECATICEKYNLWLHVDAAWGGGSLMSDKYRKLLKGIERADSVTWNPHKMLSAAQQCSTFLTRHKNILAECHSTNAAYLFQKDKFYDTKYDTGDKHIQCGRRADVLKFWFMWRAKGTNGLTAHVERIFEMAEYFTDEIKKRNDFEMVLENPECTNISFWYIPPSLMNMEKNEEYYKRLHQIAPKIKERMMKEGTMMITYQSIKGIPNFFRLVLQNSILNKNDMQHFIHEIVRLGKDL